MQLFFLATAEPILEGFYMEDKGESSCSRGSKIMAKMECQAACAALDINSIGKLKNDKPCYKAANGKCRQDGRHGLQASLVCTLDDP